MLFGVIGFSGKTGNSGVILSDVPVRLGPKDLSYLRDTSCICEVPRLARDDIATPALLQHLYASADRINNWMALKIRGGRSTIILSAVREIPIGCARPL
jgi:hypothetical protein